MLIDQLSDYPHIWILLLNNVVLKDGFGIQEVLLICQLLLIRHVLISILSLSWLWRLLLRTHIRTQYYHLHRMLYVHAIVGGLLQRTALHEVYLLVKLELLPLARTR